MQVGLLVCVPDALDLLRMTMCDVKQVAHGHTPIPAHLRPPTSCLQICLRSVWRRP
jgi:hypothetical protein